MSDNYVYGLREIGTVPRLVSRPKSGTLPKWRSPSIGPAQTTGLRKGTGSESPKVLVDKPRSG